MPLQIVRNDIAQIKADVIVNTANPYAAVGAGVDSAIYKKAGYQKLLAERAKIGDICPGQAAITPAFSLDAKYVIHTVGPVWKGGKSGERETVKDCYFNSLQLAKKNGCYSIAFPLIATGTYGFPKGEALQLAVSVIRDFLQEEEMEVFLVVFDQESFVLSGQFFENIAAYIDEKYVDMQTQAEYGGAKRARQRRMKKCLFNDRRLSLEEPLPKKPEAAAQPQRIAESICYDAMPAAAAHNLEDVIKEIGESFQKRLLRLIDEKQMSDVEIYKKANLDRKLFSKIRCNEDYKPQKKTAVALAIALELNLDDTKDLLARAGLALSPSSRFDLIISYFIENEVYDIYTINLALFQFNEQTLG